ncbi:MAG: electron transfer flavoprotein subunit alpha/FixB family protein [Propionibacteriaceae bacterium]|jgi:electron transfer flavoprotein alpha subunit|nr:electron transfer flavoprotein subunit alpha/FixB family protein [Propionibacteriaceae bacterium]
MTGIFVYSDQVSLACELAGFGKSAGAETHVVTTDEAAATELKSCGADVVHVLRGGDNPPPEAFAGAIAELLKGAAAELFLVGATVRGRELAASVAGLLDWGMASDVSGLSYSGGTLAIERLVYGGAVVQRETLPAPAVATVPAGLCEPANGSATVEIADVVPDSRVQVVGTEPIVRQGTSLAEAERIVSVGMGFNQREDLSLAEDLAAALGAEVGCSRGVAEEREWLPADRYIGISGLSVKPQLYLAVGLSGQVQHVVGIRETKVVVAVNKDEKAPIFKVCDYGIVGDLYTVLPQLTQAFN